MHNSLNDDRNEPPDNFDPVEYGEKQIKLIQNECKLNGLNIQQLENSLKVINVLCDWIQENM